MFLRFSAFFAVIFYVSCFESHFLVSNLCLDGKIRKNWIFLPIISFRYVFQRFIDFLRFFRLASPTAIFKFHIRVQEVKIHRNWLFLAIISYRWVF